MMILIETGKFLDTSCRKYPRGEVFFDNVHMKKLHDFSGMIL